jgi:hypothetical protein
MIMSRAEMSPSEKACMFSVHPRVVSLYAVSSSSARFDTTLPQMKSSDRGMPDFFTARAKPSWLRERTEAKKLR